MRARVKKTKTNSRSPKQQQQQPKAKKKRIHIETLSKSSYKNKITPSIHSFVKKPTNKQESNIAQKKESESLACVWVYFRERAKSNQVCLSYFVLFSHFYQKIWCIQKLVFIGKTTFKKWKKLVIETTTQTFALRVKKSRRSYLIFWRFMR